jgi:hypothetical protein
MTVGDRDRDKKLDLDVDRYIKSVSTVLYNRMQQFRQYQQASCTPPPLLSSMSIGVIITHQSLIETTLIMIV